MAQFIRLFVNKQHQLSESGIPYTTLLESDDPDVSVYHWEGDGALTEAEADDYADTLSSYLLENGITDFDIEISMSEEDIMNEQRKMAQRRITEHWNRTVKPIVEGRAGSHYNGAFAYSEEATKAINEHRRFKEIELSEEVILEDHEDFHEMFGYLGYVEEEGIFEAMYRGEEVKLNVPRRGGSKKFYVYVKNDKGNVVKVSFGDPNMRIRKSNAKARRGFRARHNCKNPGPKWKARYWSCRKW
jgi:hypothetical protein